LSKLENVRGAISIKTNKCVGWRCRLTQPTKNGLNTEAAEILNHLHLRLSAFICVQLYLV